MAKKGFIAAPLLGTLVFLICVLLIINMTRAESSAVSQIVSDSYHNKLVSTVEIYRSDLGSVFNIGLQRNIESILSSQCWQNFVSLKTKGITNNFGVDYHGKYILEDKNEDGTIDESEERRYACARSSSLMGDIVCSVRPENAVGYIYGLSTWAQTLSEETNFEGINLEVANADAFRSLLEYQPTLEVPLCRKLIPSVEIDCEAFSQEIPSTEAFKCCSKFVEGKCVQEAKGCEGGNQFYLQVAVQNQEVYGKFPRVLAEDLAGNKLRAGAITDVDYDAPIAYPFFKYLDAAFKFNKRLAFGANLQYDASGGDIGASRGVVEGSCLGADMGTSGCTKLAPSFQPGVDYGQNAQAEDSSKSAYIAEFINEVLKPACEEAKAENLDVFIGPQKIACEEFVKNPDFSILNGKPTNAPIKTTIAPTSANFPAFKYFSRTTIWQLKSIQTKRTRFAGIQIQTTFLQINFNSDLATN